MSSDAAVRGTAGQEVTKRSSATFLGDLQATSHRETPPPNLAERLDPETRARLERLGGARCSEHTFVTR